MEPDPSPTPAKAEDSPKALPTDAKRRKSKRRKSAAAAAAPPPPPPPLTTTTTGSTRSNIRAVVATHRAHRAHRAAATAAAAAAAAATTTRSTNSTHTSSTHAVVATQGAAVEGTDGAEVSKGGEEDEASVDTCHSFVSAGSWKPDPDLDDFPEINEESLKKSKLLRKVFQMIEVRGNLNFFRADVQYKAMVEVIQSNDANAGSIINYLLSFAKSVQQDPEKKGDPVTVVAANQDDTKDNYDDVLVGLMDGGANFHIKGNAGKTAKDILSPRKYKEIVKKVEENSRWVW